MNESLQAILGPASGLLFAGIAWGLLQGRVKHTERELERLEQTEKLASANETAHAVLAARVTACEARHNDTREALEASEKRITERMDAGFSALRAELERSGAFGGRGPWMRDGGRDG